MQCIYTAVGKFAPGAGYGHQNWFVNDGSHQPSCQLKDFMCHHHMSYIYMIHSLNPSVIFEGEGCHWSFLNMFCIVKVRDRMGLYGSRLHGTFYVKTTATVPYACLELRQYHSPNSVKWYHSKGC